VSGQQDNQDSAQGASKSIQAPANYTRAKAI